MAYVNQSTRGFGLLSGLASFFADLGDSWNRARIYRDTYAELERLSARELDDLGISRGTISRVAFDAAYKPKA